MLTELDCAVLLTVMLRLRAIMKPQGGKDKKDATLSSGGITGRWYRAGSHH
jgi:hypothetical protein